MRVTNFYFLLSVLAFSLFLSCDDKDNEPKEEQKSLVAVKSVNALSCVDLSDRTDWNFFIDFNKYNHTTNGKNIQATAKEELYRFDVSYPAGSTVPAGMGPIIRLASPGYYPEVKTKDMVPIFPDISDQSTEEKLLKADLLSNYYSGDVSEDLTGVNLIHANALLEFGTMGIPTDAEIRVRSNILITPYKENENKYKAIVLAEGGEFTAYVNVNIGGKAYSVLVPGGSYMQRDTRYNFTLIYDERKESLNIENMHRSKWSEKYPIEMAFIKKQIAEFKLFIGSPEGPKEISTDNLDPAKFWGDRLTYYPTHITFNDEKTISLTPNETSADTYNYKFEKDSLFRYNENVDYWFWAGIGDMYSLNYHIGYYRCNYYDTDFWGGGIYRFNIGQENYPASASGLWGDAHSLNSLKQETDTIMWCNINYTYAPHIMDY